MLLADRGYDNHHVGSPIAERGGTAVISAKLKCLRHFATQYDKTKETYLGFVAPVPVKLWIPFVHEA